ncbi:MAG: hypothetical protein U1C73_12230, partial [Dietzia sp.]|nr:hypothetical protein [Dietzia sp.]
PNETSGETDEDDFDELALEQDDPDAVDTAPTRVPTATEVAAEVPPDATFDEESPADSEPEPYAGFDRDPLTDTGRHARIDFDEPEPLATSLRLPLDDPSEIPEGYPIKADTGSGLYWAPDSADYDEAHAEIWFASEEMARTNGFVRG